MAARNRRKTRKYSRQLAIDLGKKIQYVRSDLDLTQETLALLCHDHPGGEDMSASIIGRIERAESLVSIEVLQALTKALSVQWSYWELEAELPWEKRRKGIPQIPYRPND